MRITGDGKVILPPLPAVAEASISPLIVVLLVPGLKVIWPAVLLLEVEVVVESSKPVVIPPGAVKAIGPPFPELE